VPRADEAGARSSYALGVTTSLQSAKGILGAVWDDSPARETNLIRRRFRGRFGPLLGAALLALLLVGMLLSTPSPSLHGEGLASLIGLTGFVALFAIELIADPGTVRWVTCFALGVSLCAILVAAVQPGGTAIVGCYAAVGLAARRLPRTNALIVTVPTVVLVMAMVLGGASDRVFTGLWVGVGFAFTFTVSRFAQVGEEQHRRERALIEEEKRSLAARTEAAALAERGRIARELHDVLAHSLSALAVELEGARMLARSRGADPGLELAIERAHQHATAGLDDARSAIEALRGDDLPGPERLGAMADGFAAEQDVPCRLEVTGEPRPLASEARLAIYRTAQEALTNVRKHAEPERVDLRLDYSGAGTRLEIADHGLGAEVSGRGDGPLSEAGAGYGVSGMRERAELLGGRLEAGPTADGFRVELWLPEAAPA
jgi:signal transduction histidine kinase